MGLSKKAKLIIGGVVCCSIINMPIATPKCTVDCSNIDLNTIDKLIKSTKDKIDEDKKNKHNDMLNEIGREYLKLQEQKKIEVLKNYLVSKIQELQASMNKSKKGFHIYTIDKAKRDMCKEILELL